MKLIDKDALVAEILRLKAEALQKKSQCKRSGLEKIMHQIGVYNKILSFLDTLEVKEVDLDFQRFAKEMDIVFALPSSETKNTEEEPLNWEYAIAKHFFELGIKAHKCESSEQLLAEMRGEEPSIPDIVDEHYFEMIEEEPISDELEEVAWLYYDKNRLPIPPECDLHKEFIDFFKAGAEWQKKQDEKDIADMLFVARLKGADDGKKIMKEQMMKNAITARCFGAQSGDALFSIRLPAKDYLVGSEIKVIIIKEENV